MMEDIEQLKDEGIVIATCLRAGQAISAWEDGSVKDDIGSHTWTVRVTNDLDNPDSNAEGVSTTAGNPATLVSLRAEHSSTLAILYFLQAICSFYQIRTSDSTVKIWIDNMEVIDRINQAIQQHKHSK